MIEEPLQIALAVERHELMHRAFGQPYTRQTRRGDGRRGEQDANLGPRLANGIDHRQRGVDLADACRVEPGEKSGRPRLARHAVTLGMPVGLLLAAPRAIGEQQRRDGRCELCHHLIGFQRCAWLRHRLLAERVSSAGKRIGARRHFGERPLDGRAPLFDLLFTLGLRHKDRIANHNGQRRERQVDREGAP